MRLGFGPANGASEDERVAFVARNALEQVSRYKGARVSQEFLSELEETHHFAIDFDLFPRSEGWNGIRLRHPAYGDCSCQEYDEAR